MIDQLKEFPDYPPKNGSYWRRECVKRAKEIEALKIELEHYRGIAMTEGAEKALADYELLKAERDELVSVVKRCAAVLSGNSMTKSELVAALESSRAILTKIKELK